MKSKNSKIANEVTKMNKRDVFEELSITELEERLELASRCICRIGP